MTSHIDIRVETSLTNAKNNNSIKLSIKLFKSLKSFKKLKFNIFNNKFNSTSRFCFSINQIAEISHIALDKVFDSTSHQSFKFFIFVVSFNSLNSTLRFYLSVNKTITSQKLSSRIDFLRALINQIIYVSINSRFRRFRQRYIVVVVAFICV